MASASRDTTHQPWLAGSMSGNVGSAADVYTWMQKAVVDGLYEDLMLSHLLLTLVVPHILLMTVGTLFIYSSAGLMTTSASQSAFSGSSVWEWEV